MPLTPKHSSSTTTTETETEGMDMSHVIANSFPEISGPKIKLTLKRPSTTIIDTSSVSPALKVKLVLSTKETGDHGGHENSDKALNIVEALKCDSESAASKTEPPTRYFGTFVYRPFRLFPLPSLARSRYQVFIPAKYTDALRNPACALNYRWQQAGEQAADLYTDDSDLVCILVRGMGAAGDILNRNVMVEVEIVKTRQEPLHHHPAQTQTHSHIWNGGAHDGCLIRVLKYSTTPINIKPRAAHLPGWRKQNTAPNSSTRLGRLLTPPFKCKLE